MTSCEYIWHHIHSLWYHTTLWHSHTLYSCHQPRINFIASTVAELLLTVYWLEHVGSMCDIKTLYVWHYMNSMWYHNNFHWYQKTVFMISHPQYSWIQTHSIWHDIHYTCDITATVTMTRHLQCFWHDSQGIWDLTHWMSDNTTTVSDLIPNVSV